MSVAPVHRLHRLPHMVRRFEHYMDENNRRLLREFESEVSRLKGSDIGSEEAKKMRRYLRNFRDHFHKGNYRKAGKDFEHLMEEIEDLEKQLGRH